MKFQRSKGILCLCILGIIAGSMSLTGCGSKTEHNIVNSQKETKAETNVFAMDTFMTITAYGPNGEAAVNAAQADIQRLDQLLSAGDPQSEVGKLNETGTGICSDDTAYLFQRSMKLYQDTDGAFDVMMYPLMETWGFISGNHAVPSQEIIDQLLPLTDPSKVIYDSTKKQIEFKEKGMKIDFGGIAKGYASSRIMDIFDQHGITSGIVNLGGNVQVKGRKPDGSNWRVGIQNPAQPGDYLGILQVSDKAVITSGGYERFFEEKGVRYHHILDPKTGKPAESGLSSVTIVSPDGTLADGLSTSLFVMGREKASQFWAAHSDLFDAVLVTDNGEIYVTEGLEQDFQSKSGKVHIIQKEQ